MIPRPLDLDQVHAFLTVVDEGSFSAAARRLRRAQSAVTYAVQELEADVGLALFDRSAYRPTLSDAGKALLPRARRVLREASALQAQAQGIAGGLEAELTLVVDSMYSMEALTSALLEFQAIFPSVTTHLRVEALGGAADMVTGGQADLGIVVVLFADFATLERHDALTIALVPVCGPSHPLAVLQARGWPLTGEEVSDHLQLVLSDRSARTQGRDHGVAGVSTWRLADLGAKLAMLRAGLGWGSLPRHMASGDLAAGHLVELDLASGSGIHALPMLQTALVRRTDRFPGPAGRWLFDRLAAEHGATA